MITFKQHGDFKKTEKFLSKAKDIRVMDILKRAGTQGVAALASYTPVASGETANSWGYSITKSDWGWTVNWTNSNVINGTKIAILIQYGHGTGTGGYVPPIDYVNPAMQPIFDRIAEEIWKEVSKL